MSDAMTALAGRLAEIEQRMGRQEVKERPSSGGPKRATMWHDESIKVTGNAIGRLMDSNQAYGWTARQNAPANGDVWTNGCFLQAGTYTLYLLGSTIGTGGRQDLTLDGTSIATGLDWYSSSQAYNVLKTVASVVVATTGWHTLRSTVNGKNGSSTNYVILLTKMWFAPSAD